MARKKESENKDSGILDWDFDPPDSGFIGFDPDFFDQAETTKKVPENEKSERQALYDYWIVGDGFYKIQNWIRQGATAKEICTHIGIVQSTFYRWVNKYPFFGAMVRDGNLCTDIKVENALLKRALGYEYEEITTEKDGDGFTVKTKTVTKQVIPDVSAQTFWLKNRRPEVWADNSGVQLSGEVKTSNPFAGMTTEQLLETVNKLEGEE